MSQGNPATGTETVTLRTADPNGLLTTTATVTAAVSYTQAAGDFDGAIAIDSALQEEYYQISITTSAAVGAYAPGSKITVTGHVRGKGRISEELTITDADGSETLKTLHCFRLKDLAISIEAQADTDGSYELGTGEAFPTPNCSFLDITAAGDVVMHLPQDSALYTRTVAEPGYLPFSPLSIHAGTTASVVNAKESIQ